MDRKSSLLLKTYKISIIAKTIKGKGVSFMENQASWHGSALNDAELKQALLDLGGACRE